MLPPSSAADARDTYRAFSAAIDRMRDGEQLVALINPEALPLDPSASSIWVSARLTIGELQRRYLPRCDERCRHAPHDAHAFVVMADLVLDPTEPRRLSWWEAWTDSLQRSQRLQEIWYAGAPVLADSPDALRLPAGRFPAPRPSGGRSHHAGEALEGEKWAIASRRPRWARTSQRGRRKHIAGPSSF